MPAGEDEEVQSSEAKVGPYSLQDFTLFHVLRYGFRPSKIAFLAWHAWHDAEAGDWPPGFPGDERPAYTLAEIRHWLEVFAQRFYGFSQFKRSALPNGPKVAAAGRSRPRGDWRAPSDMSARIWLEEIRTRGARVLTRSAVVKSVPGAVPRGTPAVSRSASSTPDDPGTRGAGLEGGRTTMSDTAPTTRAMPEPRSRRRTARGLRPPMTGRPKRTRIHHLRELKERGERWPMLTAYDMYPPRSSTRPGSRCCSSATRQPTTSTGTTTRCR